MQRERETRSHRQIHRDGKKKISVRVEVGVHRLYGKIMKINKNLNL